MGLSNCDKCKYFDRSPHHSGDIVCGLNPAYALMWKQLASVDEYTLGCMPIDSCGEFELEPGLEEKTIALRLTVNQWHHLARESSSNNMSALDRNIFALINENLIELEINLTLSQWQQIANTTSIPNVQLTLYNQGIQPQLYNGDWISVDSSCIDAIAFRDSDGVLSIRFNSGSVYEYYSVERTDFDELRLAASIGQHFNSFIKDTYDYQLIN